jgi:septum formation protein
VVIGADTAVVLGDEVFGKPGNRDECLAILAALSGRVHRVMTGVAVRSSRGMQTAVSTTDVVFREIRPDEALAYWQSGEPRDKAGAYAIQGRGGVFVAAITGSYSGVVGLPVFETAALLQDAGYRVLA